MADNKIVKKDKLPRDSNFELLRIVCMLFVILTHFIVHGLKTTGSEDVNDITFLGTSFTTFIMVAVNSYILISGYFSIKVSPRGFFRLYLMVAFYMLAINGFAFVQNGFQLKYVDKIGIILPFSHSRYWFIQSYFYLFLLSPFLNIITNNCNKKVFIGLLILGSIITFYYGFLWNGYINVDGWNFMHFVFIYLIGRFIALHTSNEKTEKKKWLSLAVYLLCSLIIIGIIQTLIYFGKPSIIGKYGLYLNNPLMVLSSIAFFLFFRNIKIHSKIINWAAVSVLAVYIVHENPVVSKYLYRYVATLGEQVSNTFILGVVIFLLAAGILVVCVLFDKVRMIITNPIEEKLCSIPWESYFDKLVDSINRIVK